MPSQAFRETLRAYESERTERLLYRMRGQDPGAPSPEQRRRAAWLASDEAGEVLERLRDPVDRTQQALQAQRARLWARGTVVAAESELRRAWHRTDSDGDSPSTRMDRLVLTDPDADRASLARTCLPPLASAAARLVAAHQEAQERFPEAYPAIDADERAAAGAFLAGTDAVTGTLVRELCARWHRGAEVSWHALARGLRQETWDGFTRPAGRFRRLAVPFSQVGLGRHLGRRLRVERVPGHGLDTPVLVRALPRDVRVCDAGAPGLLPELSGGRALGRALAFSLTGAGVPWEQGYPGWGGPGPAVGGLLMGWMGDAGYWKAMHGVGGGDGERLARVAALMVLLRARLSAVRVAEFEVGRDGAERLEWRATGLSRALACAIPPALAGLLWTGHPSHRDAAFGDVGGIAWHAHLRESLDDDCYRNPRLGDALRATCEPGLIVDLRDELGRGQALGELAVARITELLG